MTPKIRLLVRVAKRRIAAGETIDDVLDGWPALSDADKEAVRKAVS